MSTIQSFTIGSMTINASMPNPFEQDEAMSLIGSGLVQRAVIAARNNIEMGEDMLINIFIALDYPIKCRVAGILLSKAFVAGTETKADVSYFQGKLCSYNKLLAQLVLWNYSDFFTYWRDALKDVPVPPVTPQRE